MNDRMTLGEYLDAIEQVIADLKEELWQKSVDLVLDENFWDHYFKGQEYEILEMLDMGKFILSAGRRKKMEDQMTQNISMDLYTVFGEKIIKVFYDVIEQGFYQFKGHIF